MNKINYEVSPVKENDKVIDVKITLNGKTWHLWGRSGDIREKKIAEQILNEWDESYFLVVLGAGLGVAIGELAKKHRVVVIDNDPKISELTESSKLSENDNITWISGGYEGLYKQLIKLLNENKKTKFKICKIPLYQRLNPSLYKSLAVELDKYHSSTNFWDEVKYPKFSSKKPKVLFLNRPYFLTKEILSGFKKLGIEVCKVDVGMGGVVREGFVEDFLRAVVSFKPDFVLTVNHFGVDKEGKFTDLLMKLDLPLASWFVDNPHLILHSYSDVSPEKTVVFTYDAENLGVMRDKGFKNVFYLPLATDPDRFKPGLAKCEKWKSNISFVGNSMIKAVADCKKRCAQYGFVDSKYEEIANSYGQSSEVRVDKFLIENGKFCEDFLSIKDNEGKLAFESLITWEATRQYRHSCVNKLLKFNPLIVGDDAWKTVLPKSTFKHLDYLDYYSDLPRFYPMSKISFNCTSNQMKGAVNQRVFDVPACGGFILTDYRAQMENLFDLDAEVVFYKSIDDIPDLIARYLNDEDLRNKISKNGRERILADHTYEKRLLELVTIMRKCS